MAHYRIVNWDEHYEVDKDGRAWSPGKPFRQGPLEYIRVTARRDWNIKTMELADEVGEEVWFFVGIFEKLCGVVACEPRHRREDAVIRNSEGEPASIADIARVLRVKPDRARSALHMLARPQTHWLEIVGEEELQLEGQASHQHPEVLRQKHEEALRRITLPPAISADSADSADSANLAGVADFGENCSRSGQVRSEQNKKEQVKSKGLAPIAGFLGRLVPAVFHTEELDDAARGFLDSTRLGFLCEMRRTLRAEERVEARTVSNFEQWVHDNISSGRAGPDLHRESLRIARDCVHGQKPVAVFLARAKKELGYVAPSRRMAAASKDVQV
jgi:hypothetical protein